MFVGKEEGKLFTLRQLFKEGVPPPVLVFVQSKERARDLYKELEYDGLRVDYLSADRSSGQRDRCDAPYTRTYIRTLHHTPHQIWEPCTQTYPLPSC